VTTAGEDDAGWAGGLAGGGRLRRPLKTLKLIKTKTITNKTNYKNKPCSNKNPYPRQK